MITTTNLIVSNSNMVDDPDNNNTGRSNVHRALIFQGGGSLGAYDAGAHKAISEEMSTFNKKY
jgi:predicted acylesterase/phospholipase RssA